MKKYRNYNYSKRNKYSALGAWTLLLSIMIIFYGYTVAHDNSVSPISPVPTAEAREEFRIPCEKGVKEYLECQAVKGEITYKQADILLAIAKAESGLREDAIHVNRNGSVDRGIFQINTVHRSLSNKDAFDWKENTKFAIQLMKKQGFTSWTVYNRGIYKKFL